MTQALNLANFANNLNTSGATSNAGLQNSSVTVTAGTGMSGGGAVALGSSVTLTNAGVTSVVAGTGITVSGATGAVTISAGGGAAVDVQTFTSTGTWTKPSGGQTMCRIQMWGGGGGASRNNTPPAGANSGGGGGGAYNELTIPLSYLASSLTATVGGGGAGATGNASGSAGGQSSIPLQTAVNGRSTIDAYGGGGGAFGPYAGGGGGQLSAGTTNNSSGTGGIVGSPQIMTSQDTTNGQFAYLGNSNSLVGAIATGGIWNGAGGCNNNTVNGNALFGGAGGASAGTGSGGVSLWGGAGGGYASNGTAPGGGGGAANAANTNGGSGAVGRVIITSY